MPLSSSSSSPPSGPFLHSCNQCHKTFERAEHLHRHTRHHTGERPFTCLEPSCGRSFSRYDNMLQHYTSHFEKGHRRRKRIMKEKLKQEMGAKTRGDLSRIRAIVKEHFQPSFPYPEPLPRTAAKGSKVDQLSPLSASSSLTSFSSFSSPSPPSGAFTRTPSPTPESSTTSSPASTGVLPQITILTPFCCPWSLPFQETFSPSTLSSSSSSSSTPLHPWFSQSPQSPQPLPRILPPILTFSPSPYPSRSPSLDRSQLDAFTLQRFKVCL